MSAASEPHRHGPWGIAVGSLSVRVAALALAGLLRSPKSRQPNCVTEHAARLCAMTFAHLGGCVSDPGGGWEQSLGRQCAQAPPGGFGNTQTARLRMGGVRPCLTSLSFYDRRQSPSVASL